MRSALFLTLNLYLYICCPKGSFAFMVQPPSVHSVFLSLSPYYRSLLALRIPNCSYQSRLMFSKAKYHHTAFSYSHLFKSLQMYVLFYVTFRYMLPLSLFRSLCFLYTQNDHVTFGRPAAFGDTNLGELISVTRLCV